MTERSYVDDFCDAETLLCDAKDELAYIARCLHVVGNDALADTIASIGVEVGKGVSALREGRGKALSDHLRSVEQGTANMIGAALAMVNTKAGAKTQLTGG